MTQPWVQVAATCAKQLEFIFLFRTLVLKTGFSTESIDETRRAG